MERAHITILRRLLEKQTAVTRILDAGSGRTSLLELVQAFPAAWIDAVVYPGDQRKLQAIAELTEKHPNICALEKDLCRGPLDGPYDLVVAHLLLGEATKFGNSFETLLSHLLDIPGNTYIVIDYLEDPNVDDRAIETACKDRGLVIQERMVAANEEPQVWDDFTGDHNFGYLILRNSK